MPALRDAIRVDSLQALRRIRRAPVSFVSLGAFSSSIVRLEYDGSAFDTGVEGVTAEYFDVLGVRAKEGRLFHSGDDPHTASAVITARLATRLFGDASAIGKRIVADGRPLDIIAADPWTIAGAAAVFVLTTSVAAWRPALRASRIQPYEALRQD